MALRGPCRELVEKPSAIGGQDDEAAGRIFRLTAGDRGEMNVKVSVLQAQVRILAFLPARQVKSERFVERQNMIEVLAGQKPGSLAH